MSSFKNAHKSNQKKHRERGQLSSRKHLGLLEKKKDYKERATDYQRKQKTIKALKRKALDRNPDEFYFNMVSTRTEDGVHVCKDEAPTYTDEQIKLINTQDIKYVNFKRSLELKKIARLKSSLHMLGETETPNKHIVFLDTKKQVKEFDAATHFDTHPSLMGRKYNRLKTQQLGSNNLEDDEETMSESVAARKKKYKELTKRLEREKQLKIIGEKLQMKHHLSSGKEAKHKTKIKEETTSSAAVYKWAPQRKR